MNRRMWPLHRKKMCWLPNFLFFSSEIILKQFFTSGSVNTVELSQRRSFFLFQCSTIWRLLQRKKFTLPKQSLGICAPCLWQATTWVVIKKFQATNLYQNWCQESARRLLSLQSISRPERQLQIPQRTVLCSLFINDRVLSKQKVHCLKMCIQGEPLS